MTLRWDDWSRDETPPGRYDEATDADRNEPPMFAHARTVKWDTTNRAATVDKEARA